MVSSEGMTVHSSIRDRRRAIGLSAQQLADMAGLSRPTVHNYESGKHVSDLNIARIEQALAAAETAHELARVKPVAAVDLLALKELVAELGRRLEAVERALADRDAPRRRPRGPASA